MIKKLNNHITVTYFTLDANTTNSALLIKARRGQ